MHTPRPVAGSCGKDSVRSVSDGVADVLESEQRRAKLSKLGRQVLEPDLGVLTSQEKLDWASEVL